MKYEIKNKEILKLSDDNRLYLCANQAWYFNKWHIKSGCGPTNAAQLIYYFSLTRTEYNFLSEGINNTKSDFIKLMNLTWQYVTPSILGVNNVSIFEKGLRKYFLDNGLNIPIASLDLRRKIRKIKYEEVEQFIIDGLSNDSIIAFLNLSNGNSAILSSWHWTSIVAYDDETKQVTIYDASSSFVINMEEWYRTTILGGGLVYINK